ncbi:MAG: hypothetical protein HQL63_02870 [Magnetococcales bacterium]|nr:hypothetical protein [Magnetococcales bacterium]MBF0321590.1 hypothetical protein [Magnetococcales bacterium]
MNDAIYDACLQFDGSNNPWNWSAGSLHTPMLLLQTVFSKQPLPLVLPIATPFTDLTYRERLATNDSNGIGSCFPTGQRPYTQSGRRAVK